MGVADMGADSLKLYGVELSSRLLAGTAQYPSPAILSRAIATALNRNFVRKTDRGKTPLKEGDTVEILVPRQGG